jgi:hypothetical protein
MPRLGMVCLEVNFLMDLFYRSFLTLPKGVNLRYLRHADLRMKL